MNFDKNRDRIRFYFNRDLKRTESDTPLRGVFYFLRILAFGAASKDTQGEKYKSSRRLPATSPIKVPVCQKRRFVVRYAG
jgi:hypothetical protein